MYQSYRVLLYFLSYKIYDVHRRRNIKVRYFTEFLSLSKFLLTHLFPVHIWVIEDTKPNSPEYEAKHQTIQR